MPAQPLIKTIARCIRRVARKLVIYEAVQIQRSFSVNIFLPAKSWILTNPESGEQFYVSDKEMEAHYVEYLTKEESQAKT